MVFDTDYYLFSLEEHSTYTGLPFSLYFMALPGALLARQIWAVLVTTNISDFKKIHQVVDFKFRKVM
ncbi:MAG: hypothetical protein U9R02_16395 [Thermodesulfobacteriota bacterium]|nr:hypothetical protein [Thermodesulfobacteriota bacterium]